MPNKLHEAMTVEGQCPRCGGCDLYREDVDIGVGTLFGPWGCPDCGWSEDTAYDIDFDGGVQENGSYRDPYGCLLPATNPIAKMLAKEAREECARRGIDPDELCADGGVEAWMVVAKELEEERKRGKQKEGP